MRRARRLALNGSRTTQMRVVVAYATAALQRKQAAAVRELTVGADGAEQ